LRAGASVRRVATGAARRVSGTLPALLDDVAARFGPCPALIAPRRRMTYGELAADADGIAAALTARGAGKGTHVGLLLPNWPEWIGIAFGVWRTGAVLVPLNTLARPRELGHALGHADVELLIAVRRFLRHDYVAAVEGVAPAVLREVVWLEPPAADGAV